MESLLTLFVSISVILIQYQKTINFFNYYQLDIKNINDHLIQIETETINKHDAF